MERRALLALCDAASAAGDNASRDTQPCNERSLVPIGDLSGTARRAHLCDVVAIAAGRPAAKFQQRGWELLQHARTCKRVAAAEAGAEKSKKKARSCQAVVAYACQQSSMVAKSLGLERRTQLRLLTAEQRCEVIVQLATTVRIKGGDTRNYVATQHKAREVFVAASVECQRDYIGKRLAGIGVEVPRSEGGDAAMPDPAPAPRKTRLVMFIGSWDETTQKLREFRKRELLPGMRQNNALTSIQVMVMGGWYHEWLFHASGEGEVHDSQQWFMRPYELDGITANHLLDALLREVPINLTVRDVAAALSTIDVFIWQWCTDRASANFSVIYWMWQQLQKMPVQIMGHLEVCWSHGLALVKKRGLSGKILGACISLSRALRIGKNQETMLKCALDLLRNSMIVVHEPRPPEMTERGHRVARCLFGDIEDSASAGGHLWREGKHGTRRPTALLKDLRAMIQCGCFGPEEDRIKHYCYVCEGSPEAAAGKAIGSPCCSTLQESLEKEALPRMNWLLGRGWVQACESRWTHAGITTLRAALSVCDGDFLGRVLRMWMLHWQLNDDLAAQLEREIKMSAGGGDDWHKKNRLRICKIGKVFNTPLQRFEFGVFIPTLRVVEDLLFNVLGTRKERVSALTFLHPRESPLVNASAALRAFLHQWGPERWELLHLLGASFDDAELMFLCRRQVLMVSSGLDEYFNIRLSAPPYCLAALCFEGLLSRTDALSCSASFFRSNDSCLSHFCRRFKTAFRNKYELLDRGVPHLARFFKELRISIDYCERAHASIRKDIQASQSGKARDFDGVANNHTASEVKNLHLEAGGSVKLSSFMLGDLGDTEKKTHEHGGPYILYRNSRAAAYRSMYADTAGKLSEEEEVNLELKLAEEWERIKEDPDQYQAWVDASKRKPGTPSPGKRCCSATGDAAKKFEGLWGNKDPNLVVPLEVVRKHQEKLKEKDKERKKKKAGRRPEHAISDPPDRMKDVGKPDSRMILGCCGTVGVCTDVLHGFPLRQWKFHSRLRRLFSRYVDSVGKDLATSCRLLCAFEASGAGGGDDDGGEVFEAIVLLVDVRYSPKRQMLCACHREDSGLVAARPPTYPYRVHVADAPHRLSRMLPDAAQQVNTYTSDEFFVALWASKGDLEWKLKPLVYEIESLVTMKVLSAMDEFISKKSDNSEPSAAVMNQLFGQVAVYSGGADENDGGDGDFDGLETDDEFGEAAPFAEDIAEDVAAHFDFNPAAAADGAEAEGQGDGAGLDDGDALLAAAAAARDAADAETGLAEEEVTEDAGVQLPPPSDDPLARALAACSIEPSGLIVCRAAGHFPMETIGRIETFPNHLPMNQRGVKVYCKFHKGRCLLSCARKVASDAQLIEWVVRGHFHQPTAGEDPRESHIALGKAMRERWKS